MMTNKKIDLISSFLDERYPNVGCELKYNKDYELVIAVMLSAQTTDVAVNRVTEILFKKYTSLEDLAKANVFDVEEIIKSIGLYKNKAQRIVDIANKLINDFDGKVLSDKDVLQTLPGVGNKTAGVIRAEIFKIPDFPVDTHILRISKRLKLANENDDAYDVEMKLKHLFKESTWIKLHHQLIHFGRDVCLARKPLCENCKLSGICTKK